MGSSAKHNDEIGQNFRHATESLPIACKKITYYSVYFSDEILLLKPVLAGCNGYSDVSKYPWCNARSLVADQDLRLFQQLSIHLKYKNCPMGFTLHNLDQNCVCCPSLLSLGLGCDIDTTTIRRNNQQWIGVTYEHITVSDQYPGVIAHQYCPFDYCQTDKKSLRIRLEDETELCAFNRSGILCGGCATNFSRVLGSSKCRVCFVNYKLFIIILGWLLAGALLVILLMVLDLTVSIGTINGLTLYANISFKLNVPPFYPKFF